MPLEVCCDTLLVVSQWRVCSQGRMNGSVPAARSHLKVKVSLCNSKQVPWSANNHANCLANLVSAVEYQFRREIPVEYIVKPIIQQSGGKVLHLDTSSGWRDPIITYLKVGVLPNDRDEAQKLQHLPPGTFSWGCPVQEILL